jgi:aminoglycoside 6'-N-acetyltransferase I
LNIVEATAKDLWAVTRLALLLWPDIEAQQLYEEMHGFLTDPENALFVAKEDGAVAGFAHCALRHDYVEGTDSSPVGYLEGIFVEEVHRGQHVAKMLVEACERFSKEKGCAEFASDCELHNQKSIAFHRGVGFVEANRLVCFVKKL